MKLKINKRLILRSAKQVLSLCGEPLAAARGCTLRELFVSADHGSVRVFWGLWSVTELDIVICGRAWNEC